MSSINWDLFDKIYCVHYLPYKERYTNIKNELDRIGVLNSQNFQFYYTTPNKYYDYVFLSDKNFKNINNVIYTKMVNNITDTDNPSVLNSTIDYRFVNNTNINLLVNMLNLLHQIKCNKYKRVMIIEDDVFFLKDLDIVGEYINNIPQNFNVINFDPFIYKMDKYNPKTYNNYYLDVSTSEVYNASCICLDNVAVDKILQWQDKMTLPWDNYMQYKGLEDDNLTRYVPNKNICIQRDYDERQEFYYKNDKTSKYKNLNINMDDYYELETV